MLSATSGTFAAQTNSTIYLENGSFSSSPAAPFADALPSIPVLRISIPQIASPETREPHQVGYPIKLPDKLKPLNALLSAEQWANVNGKEYALVDIEVSGALGLRAEIFINTSFLGKSYWLSNPKDYYAIAAAPDGTWTPISHGSHLLLLFERKTEQSFNPEEITISRISVIDTQFSRANPNSFTNIYPETASCAPDLACAINAEAKNQGKSVAKLSFVRDGKPYVCSGTLLNDTNSTFTPYVFTASHCIDSQQVAKTVVTTWNLEYPGCYNNNSGAPKGSIELRGGAQLLNSDENNDHAFIVLADKPPAGSMYSGWNSNPLDAWTNIFSINHPHGDVKKISFGNITDPNTSSVIMDNKQRTDLQSMEITTGTIQPGSSGGGVFTCSEKTCHLRGAISSVEENSTCSPNQRVYAARFDRAYPSIKRWLEAPSIEILSLSFSDWPTTILAEKIISVPKVTAIYNNGEQKIVSPKLSSSNQDILWFSDGKIFTGKTNSDESIKITVDYDDGGNNFIGTITLTVQALPVNFWKKNIDCLLNWAEIQYPTYLPTKNKYSDIRQIYTCRSYSTTDTVVCTSAEDPYFYYYGPLSRNEWLNLGPLSNWLNTSKCN